MNAADIIRSEIRACGPLPFARFMELALYAPGAGYYEQPERIGKRGDFYTAASVGPLFGELLAFWAAENKPPDTEWNLIEAGAHDGRLAADMLGWIRTCRPDWFGTLEYHIIEPSERRRAWQEKTLRPFAGKVRWRTAPPDAGVCGLMFSNELLDAFPVHRFRWNASGRQWREMFVDWRDGRFVWTEAAPSAEPPRLPEELAAALPDGFCTETCPAAAEWWHKAARSLRRGKLMTLDYGCEALDLFRPERREGTLRAFSRHMPDSDLLADPGGRDLTAHVNFTAIRTIGEAAGLVTEGLSPQSGFLTTAAVRLLKSPEAARHWDAARVRQFHTLTHPGHLGRAFHVLVQAKQTP